MPGGKGKSTGGKAGPKEAAGKSQKSHSAKAGLQVSVICSGCRCRQETYCRSRHVTQNSRLQQEGKMEITTGRRA